MIKLYKGSPANAFCKLTISFFFFKIHFVKWLEYGWNESRNWAIVIQKWPFDPTRVAYFYVT